MGNYDDVLPEEVETRDQHLIEDLRRAYRPALQDARTQRRIRERLLAGDGWHSQREPIPFSFAQQREESGTRERQSDNVTMFKRKRWRHVLGTIAAVLTISFVVGALLLTLDAAHRTSTGTGFLYPHPETLIDLHMFSASTGWALSTDNRVLRTTNGGVNWKEVTPPDLLGLEKRFSLAGPWVFRNFDTAWVAVTVNKQQTPEYHSSTAALIFHTIDGGAIWQKTALKLSGQRVGALVFVNAYTGWLLSLPDVTIVGPERDSPFDIWHTTDGGKTWAKILDGSSSHARLLTGVTAPSISFGNEQVGLMVGQNKRLYRTIDGGVTWQMQPWHMDSGNIANFGVPQFFTATDAFFTSTTTMPGLSGSIQKLSVVVYTTHDAGLTWQASPTLSLVPPQDKQGHVGWMAGSNAPMFIDTQHGWISLSTDPTTTITGKPSLVQYRTIDGGHHWTQLPGSLILNSSSTRFDYSFSSFISPGIGWLADMGSEGVVLFKTVNGGHTWIPIHAKFPSFVRVPSAS